jgi:hypothetical protein
MENSTRIYAKDSNMVARKIAGEMVLVPIRQNVGDLASIYNLNEVGARIWELVDGKATAGQIKDRIVEEYEVTPEQAEADLMEFLNQLEQIKAVSLVIPVQSIG